METVWEGFVHLRWAEFASQLPKINVGFGSEWWKSMTPTRFLCFLFVIHYQVME